MKALVVYESFFGNTERIAKTIGEALKAKTIEVSAFSPDMLNGIDLLVVGSPTRAFRPSTGTVDFLNNLPVRSLDNIKVAAFDTGIKPKDIKKPSQRVILSGFVSVFGYAAKPIAKKLIAKGGKLVGAPEGFFVLDTEGPLKKGELKRAESFAQSLIGAEK